MKGLHYFRQPWPRQGRIVVSWALGNLLWAIGAFVVRFLWEPVVAVHDFCVEVWVASFGNLEAPPAPLPPQRELGWVLREYYEKWGST